MRVSELLDVVGGFDGSVGSGNHGDVGLDGEVPGCGLVAEYLERLGCGTDERDTGVSAPSCELGALGEKAVARMDGIDLVSQGYVEDRLLIEVSADGLVRRADGEGFVRLVAVDGELVRVRVDRECTDAELGASTEDADGDLPAVGRHDFRERALFHRGHCASMDRFAQGAARPLHPPKSTMTGA